MTDGEALLAAAREGDLDRIAELLDQNPELLNYRNELGQGAVMLAKYHKQQSTVDWLIEKGAELTLHEAAAAGVADRVESLLEADAGALESFSKDGFTPLTLACYFGNGAVAAALLNRGAQVNVASKNPMGVYPLHAAAAGKHLDIVRALVIGNADVNAKQQQGFTALHSAANNGDEEMVRFLLAHEADPKARSDGGQTPLDLAMTQGHASVANLLTLDDADASSA